jgi:hypothetical protein
MAPVLILRWYWWRITAWTEITAMAASLLVGNLLVGVGPLAVPLEGPDHLFGPRLMATMLATAAAWIPVTFISRPTSQKRLADFRACVNPGGPGWTRVARLDGGAPPPGIVLRLFWVAVGTTATWLGIIGTGWVVLGSPGRGLMAILAAVAMAIPTIRAASRLAGGLKKDEAGASRG